MRLSRPLIVSVIVGTALGCGGGVTARDQWTVVIATDAPAPTLVDRALVEVMTADGELACDDCRRQLGLPVDPAAWPISFGIAAPPSKAALHLRVRLYRAKESGNDGFPLAATAIDRIAALPPARGDTEVALAMHAECLGLAADLEAREACVGPERELIPETELPRGRPDPAMRPGTWARSLSQPCASDPPDGMVCVPGGFFVLGDSRVVTVTRIQPFPERFVSVTPFGLDVDEVNVGVVRRLLRDGKITSAPKLREADPSARDGECTFLGRDDASNDALPVNCVPHGLARSVCAALGRRLPTEAEWEWAAGNLELETFYPWGDEGDPCAYADVGVGRYGLGDLLESPLCRARPGAETLPGGLPRTANPSDVTALGVRGLAGGVSEWTSGKLQPYDARCWSSEPFLADPKCDTGDNFAIRGSSWLDTPGLVGNVKRQGAPALARLPSIGFRCAVTLAE
ncbi:MAG: SUMF1/EgtB/PvdO family nonheme iron enzyme [Labilithrix sp.]|nr:SUMF1/EgtB/PvdO family nonheme iron enzyme [Labilithrix sp.]